MAGVKGRVLYLEKETAYQVGGAVSGVTASALEIIPRCFRKAVLRGMETLVVATAGGARLLASRGPRSGMLLRVLQGRHRAAPRAQDCPAHVLTMLSPRNLPQKKWPLPCPRLHRLHRPQHLSF